MAGDKTRIFKEEIDSSNSEEFYFVSQNIQSFYKLYEIEEYKNEVLKIFIHSLKQKSMLPCMVASHILISCECEYLLRNFLETCLNSINASLQLIVSRIRTKLNVLSTSEEIKEENEEKKMRKEDLKEIIENECQNNFLLQIKKHSGTNKLLSKINLDLDA